MTTITALFAIAIGIVTGVLSTAVMAVEAPANSVDIRGEDGAFLVAAGNIVSYDWSTHTLTLAPGARAKLAAELPNDSRLVRGIPFAIAVGGKAIYTGKFTSMQSSLSLSTPVILIEPKVLAPELAADQLRIQLGYPTAQFFRGQDPRGDARLRAALRATGKLTKPPAEFTQWIVDSLIEIQAISPGQTRADLLRVFEEEGGLSTRRERRYAYRDCTFIKVNVRFEPVEQLDDPSVNHPQDKIVSISQPFLEWSIAD
jgi:hypothetical protein